MLLAVSFEKIVDMMFVPIKSWEKIVSSSLVYIEFEYTIGIHDKGCVLNMIYVRLNAVRLQVVQYLQAAVLLRNVTKH